MRTRTPKSSLPSPSKKCTPGVVRIVGGLWRQTPLTLADKPGLRPTPQRVRETVFDWLNHLKPDLDSVLDLFAGSGAMGFEAASRGATRVDWVDTDRQQVLAMKKTLEKLDTQTRDKTLNVHALEADRFLNSASAYDFIVMDPPYALGRDLNLWRRVVEHLAPNGLIYTEHDQGWLSEEVLNTLELTPIRRARAGQVYYELLSRTTDPVSAMAKIK